MFYSYNEVGTLNSWISVARLYPWTLISPIFVLYLHMSPTYLYVLFIALHLLYLHRFFSLTLTLSFRLSFYSFFSPFQTFIDCIFGTEVRERTKFLNFRGTVSTSKFRFWIKSGNCLKFRFYCTPYRNWSWDPKKTLHMFLKVDKPRVLIDSLS